MTISMKLKRVYVLGTLAAWAAISALPSHAANAGIVEKLFIQNGTGAVPISMAEKLKESVSALDFGADKTGVASSSAAIQKALDTCKNVLLPDGAYKITTGITNACGTSLFSISPGSVTFNVVGSGYDALTLAADYADVSGINFTAAAARTSGAYVNVSTVTRGNAVKNFVMKNAYVGVKITANAVITRISDGEILNTAPGTGIGILVAGGNDTFINKVVMDNPVGAQPLAGIKLKSTQAVWVTDTDVIHSGTPLLIAPDGNDGDMMTWCFFKSFAADLSSGPGISIAPVNGATVKGMFFSNSWTSSNLVGVSITKDAPSAVDTIEFTDHTAFNNLNQGALITAGNNIGFNGSRIAGNSQSASNTYAGIEFANGAQNFSVKNTRSGAIAGFPDSQKYGALIGTGANIYEVTNNNFLGNASGAFADNSYTTSTTRTVRDNMGAKTRSTGMATIVAGTNQLTVNHGLFSNPNIVITSPANANLGGLSYWTGTYTATQFNINTSGNVSGNTPFAWEATMYE